MLRNILCLILLVTTSSAHNMQLQLIDSKTNASFRGLSVINDSDAWVSGSKGWVGTTINGGKDWRFRQVKGYEQCDFRSIYAFNAKNAVIANAGAPAYILYTSDSGYTWQKVYENDDSAAFIDGIDFWDHKFGIMYGDPLKGHMLLAHTKDGGKTWTEYPSAECPALSPGEASFAASGTCIKCVQRKKLFIATGGTVSRLLVSKNRGKSWKAINTPILQGTASTGIFTFLPLGKKLWVIAGGDYKNETLRTANLFITENGGENWYEPYQTTRGYTECLQVLKHTDAVNASETPIAIFTSKNTNTQVAVTTTGMGMSYKNVNTLLAVSPQGIDISYNNGNNWTSLSDEKHFHVVKKSRTGNLVLLAGGDGKLAILKKGKKDI